MITVIIDIEDEEDVTGLLEPEFGATLNENAVVKGVVRAFGDKLVQKMTLKYSYTSQVQAYE